MLSFIDFEASFVMLFKDKAKVPQNMKSSDRFRTVFDSAVLCQLFQAPYTYFDDIIETKIEGVLKPKTF